MHLHSSVAGVGAGLPAVDVWTLLDPAGDDSGNSKPQLWTGHSSPRFRNNPHHATTVRPCRRTPAHCTMDKVATPPQLSEAVKMQAGTSAGGFSLFRSPAPALTDSCQRIRWLKSYAPVQDLATEQVVEG